MQKNSQWIFIINPVAGNGFASEYAQKVKEKIEEHNLPAEIVYTERKGHATEIAADYAQKGFDHIIAVGGDGTLSETIQGLVGREGITLGIISAGTGNDFVTILGFSEHFTDNDWNIFFEKNIIKMDVGKCNDHYFINGMGLGYDAQVASENYEPEESQKVKTGSKSKYWWHILKTLVVYKEKEMKIIHKDNVQTKKTFLNTIANGRRLAGGFYLTPDAIANDGLLNVCMIDELKFPGRVKALLRVMGQKHTEDEVVNYFKTDNIRFEFDSEVPAHLDGELIFNTKFEICAVPESLNIIYNPHGDHFFQ